jgi:FtsZ-binding cell division protein ZapB
MSWTDYIIPLIVALPGIFAAIMTLVKSRADANQTITQTALSLISPLKDENARLLKTIGESELENDELRKENDSLRKENAKLKERSKPRPKQIK